MVNITEIQLFFYLEIISANISPGENFNIAFGEAITLMLVGLHCFKFVALILKLI